MFLTNIKYILSITKFAMFKKKMYGKWSKTTLWNLEIKM
jgi:hypothetical protein